MTSQRRRRVFLTAAIVLTHAATMASCAPPECATGLQKINDRCVDPCGGCGGGRFCDTSAPLPECRCPPGYVADPCEFDAVNGLVKDPDFQGLEDPDTNERYWLGDGETGASVFSDLPFSNLPEFAGDTGVGLVPARAICAGESLRQVLSMPSLEQTDEPLVAEVVYQARRVHGLAVGFGRSWTRLSPTAEHAEGAGGTGGDGTDCADPENLNCEVGRAVICLGEGAYGKPPTEEAPTQDEVIVRIGVSEPSSDCWPGNEPVGTILVRRFWIRPAEGNECENPDTGAPIAAGEVLNGEANPNRAGWRFEIGAGVEGALETNLGADGTPGARLARDASNSESGAMITKLSVPLPAPSTPAPALRFWTNGTAQHQFTVAMGTWLSHDDRGRQVDTFIGAGPDSIHIYCLPPWTHGNVVDLSFSLTDANPSENTQLVVDQVEIIDSDCGSDPALPDPTFDSNNEWFGATRHSRLQLVTTENFGAPPLNEDDNRFLELRNGDADADMSMETYLLVPEADEKNGPAVFFQATSPTESPLRLLRGQGEIVDGSAETNSTWQELLGCLPASWAGRWFRFEVNLGPVESSGFAQVFLDDFSLGTSARCPSD
jgi:hypothetical protein